MHSHTMEIVYYHDDHTREDKGAAQMIMILHERNHYMHLEYPKHVRF